MDFIKEHEQKIASAFAEKGIIVDQDEIILFRILFPEEKPLEEAIEEFRKIIK